MPSYLRASYVVILKVMSSFLMLFSLILIIPLVFSLFYREPSMVPAFLMASALSLVLSLVLRTKYRSTKMDVITSKEGAVIVLFCWLVAIFLSALPYTFARILSLSRAIFEATSGWTTTGLTVIANVESMPKTILFWRSLTQFLGGAGFAIIVMGAIIGPTGLGLYQAEGRVDNIVPNIKYSARIIMFVYMGYAGVGTVALKIAGMDFFDALNHSLTALATGGFSTKNNSIGSFNSVGIEIVTMILMWLGATGFGIHYAFWQRNWQALKKNPEPKQMALFTATSVTILTAAGLGRIFPTAFEGIRRSLFQVVSAITGTGFSTSDLKTWLGFPPGILVLTILMLLGGCMDSTSGGVKQYRIAVMLKTLVLSVKRFVLPRNAVVQVEIWKGNNKRYLDDSLIREAFLVSSLYVISFIAGSVILSVYGYRVSEAIFEFASALAGVGLSVGITGYSMPNGALWTLITGMFLGRLEFLVVIYAISKILKDISSITQRQKTAV
ncbi:MAG TPA: TrkH family potassium uptake protein [Pseudothermotoga sp.]|nr:TrkH family potassium uptake protein [Pseudothermotoga sp.]HPP70245.1 TrkH family potassium uptake protein [Pseudothermotoga sp.]